jgi:hypothetical protein
MNRNRVNMNSTNADTATEAPFSHSGKAFSGGRRNMTSATGELPLELDTSSFVKTAAFGPQVDGYNSQLNRQSNAMI